MRRIWPLLIIVPALCVASYFVGRKRAVETVINKTDTVTVVTVDTLIRENPIYVNRYFRDTIFVAITDTVRLRDTTFIRLPKEHRLYVDSMYRAVVSGYQPSLDSIEVYQKCYTKIVTNTVKPRWSVGIQAGYGVTRGFELAPYVGIGIQYRLF